MHSFFLKKNSWSQPRPIGKGGQVQSFRDKVAWTMWPNRKAYPSFHQTSSWPDDGRSRRPWREWLPGSWLSRRSRPSPICRWVGTITELLAHGGAGSFLKKRGWTNDRAADCGVQLDFVVRLLLDDGKQRRDVRPLSKLECRWWFHSSFAIICGSALLLFANKVSLFF